MPQRVISQSRLVRFFRRRVSPVASSTFTPSPGVREGTMAAPWHHQRASERHDRHLAAVDDDPCAIAALEAGASALDVVAETLRAAIEDSPFEREVLESTAIALTRHAAVLREMATPPGTIDLR